MTGVVIGPGAEISPGDADALADLADRAKTAALTAATVPLFCEVGSWRGMGSTQVLARYATLVCVDTWLGNPAVPHHAEFRQVSDPYQHFLANTTGLDVKPRRGPSVEIAPQFADGHFDLVFIDADHRYAGVWADIQVWKSKVKKGGILCGHDCEMRPDDACRKALAERPDLEWIDHPKSPLGGVHYGVACAVDEEFGARVKLFAEGGRKSSVWWIEI